MEFTTIPSKDRFRRINNPLSRILIIVSWSMTRDADSPKSKTSDPRVSGLKIQSQEIVDLVART